MRVIKIKNCQECPYSEHNNGQGHGGSFVMCGRFGFMLKDEDGSENFDIWSGVCPKCRLAKNKEIK